MLKPLRKLQNLDVAGKKILLRVDLNVPLSHGNIIDKTRITRLLPTLNYLIENDAKIIILSHFGRPKGEFIRDMSLAPLVNVLIDLLGGKEVKFALNSIGNDVKESVDNLQNGEIILLENLRFHPGEEANDLEFIDHLATLGDYYVNDTFSCSHRQHASIVGLAEKLPSFAGFLLQEEIENLEHVLENPNRPIAAIVGGAKISSKLKILNNLIEKVDHLFIGGAMANSFLVAKDFNVGKSLYEKDLVTTAKDIIERAKSANCEIFIPHDVIVAPKLDRKVSCEVKDVHDIDAEDMILDIGPLSINNICDKLQQIQTVIWNGPFGAFEIPPFNCGTINIARIISYLTHKNKLVSIAGGGDIVASLTESGLSNNFTYLSTAGGAFLEWLEGKDLPGIEILRN
ncbi:MAG: phosphoglycerate kinase [Pseudomonadota bacterium]